MTQHRLRSASLIAPMLAVALLAACGRQESVDELPDANAIVNAADASKVKPELDDRFIATGKDRTYVDAAHGFSILLPEGWVRNDTLTGPEGVVFGDPGAGADIRVNWSKNASDTDLQQMVEGMNDGGEAVEGNFVAENDYRGSANDGEGNRVVMRILRLADGSAASATIVFPEMLSDQYEKIAKDSLASLKPVGAAAAAPSPAAPATPPKP